MSKSLLDIILAVKKNEKPDYEELRYAVLALEALHVFDSMALMKLSEGQTQNKKPVLNYSATFQYEESFNRAKRALSKAPKEWVGWNNDPENPEYQKRRGMSEKIFEKVMNKCEGKNG